MRRKGIADFLRFTCFHYLMKHIISCNLYNCVHDNGKIGLDFGQAFFFDLKSGSDQFLPESREAYDFTGGSGDLKLSSGFLVDSCLIFTGFCYVGFSLCCSISHCEDQCISVWAQMLFYKGKRSFSSVLTLSRQ